MPCFRTLTGWRCRKKFVSITTTRLRRSLGIGWRKTLFQTCVSVILSTMAIVGPWGLSCLVCQGSGDDEAIRVAPLLQLFLVLLALVDDHLAGLVQADLEP